MTERLKQLLHDEAGELAVPAPAPDAVLRDGRGLRRRNRLVVGGAGLAAAVIVGGTVAAVTAGGDDRAAPDPAAPSVGGNAVFSWGNQVFYDGPEHVVEIQDTAVKSLFYTSAGVLVRHGDNANSDGGGPQRFSLVTPDGTVRRLGLETEETVHAADTDQPYVTYGEAVDGELQVVVYDVAEDAEAARVPVVDTPGTWFPVAIDGDTVYVTDAERNQTYAVDWQAGTSAESDLTSVWGMAGGRVATDGGGDDPTVVDVATGETLLVADEAAGTSLQLSPDGRYARVVHEEEDGSEDETEVYDVAAGTSVLLPTRTGSWGWTADGDLFRVLDDAVETCDTATGECARVPYAQPRIPEPDPITYTMSDPVCPDGGLECHTDPEFFDRCYENPDECEWRESTYVEEQSIQLRLGGLSYES